MPLVRQLNADEYQAWDKFVTDSPQAGLFQTIKWAQFLCETDEQGLMFLPLASIEDDKFSGGIVVCYRKGHGSTIVDPPLFGYNGPALAPALDRPDRDHTYSVYSVLAGLLNGLEEKIESITLVNQPEIWDTRAFMFQSWHTDTAYTHIWHCPDRDEAWKQIQPDIQKSIRASQNSLTFKAVDDEIHIQKFIELIVQQRPITGMQKIQPAVFHKRIKRMQAEDNGRLYTLTDSSGRDIGMALIILSRENQTAYLWDAVCAEPEREADLLPYLYHQIYSSLADRFSRLDLGQSRQYAIGEIKDQLGCELTPIFITTRQMQKSRKVRP